MFERALWSTQMNKAQQNHLAAMVAPDEREYNNFTALQ